MVPMQVGGSCASGGSLVTCSVGVWLLLLVVAAAPPHRALWHPSAMLRSLTLSLEGDRLCQVARHDANQAQVQSAALDMSVLGASSHLHSLLLLQ